MTERLCRGSVDRGNAGTCFVDGKESYIEELDEKLLPITRRYIKDSALNICPYCCYDGAYWHMTDLGITDRATKELLGARLIERLAAYQVECEPLKEGWF